MLGIELLKESVTQTTQTQFPCGITMGGDIEPKQHFLFQKKEPCKNGNIQIYWEQETRQEGGFLKDSSQMIDGELKECGACNHPKAVGGGWLQKLVTWY